MNEILSSLIEETYEKTDYLSGEVLAEKLSVSRVSISKKIEKLRAEGYKIESVTKKGYRLTAFPKDRFIPEKLRFYFPENPFEILFLPEVGSTNRYAKELAAKGHPTPFLVATNDQTEGRGRLQRTWLSSSGKDLTFTLGIAANCDFSRFYHFTQLISVAICRAVQKILPEVKIKWPNDLYVGSKKLCGILTETITEQNRIVTMLIGAGLNVNSIVKKASDDYKGTSILTETGKEAEREKLLAEIIREFTKVKKLSDEALFEEWEKNLAFLDKTVRINTGREVIEGILTGVDKDASVLIQTADGEKKFFSGDLIYESES